MRSVLITGGTGFVGYCLQTYLREHTDWVIKTTSRTNSGFVDYPANLAVSEEVRKLSHTIHPDIIIHTAAMSKTDFCEKNREDCFASNVTATEHIVTCFPKSKIIFFSTYAVYNTEEGSCTERCSTVATNYYIGTKLAAEDIIGRKKDNLIIRPSVIFGYLPRKRATQNYLMQLLANIRNGVIMSSPRDQYFNPISGMVISEILRKAIDTDISGVFNIGCNEDISKYDFNTMILSRFGLPMDAVQSVSGGSLAVQRPGNGTISSEAIQRSLSYKITSLSSMIEREFESFQKESESISRGLG